VNLPRVSLTVDAERFEPGSDLRREDVDVGALGERRHDLAGEAEDGGLVGRAVADDERAAAVGERFEDTAERGGEPRPVLTSVCVARCAPVETASW
jgi:hypothetical protein